jgi:hypothetical protein
LREGEERDEKDRRELGDGSSGEGEAKKGEKMGLRMTMF